MVIPIQDQLIEAVCECGKDERTLTLRKLKNKWPHCECRQAMKVINERFSTLDGMGDARGIAQFIRSKGNGD